MSKVKASGDILRLFIFHAKDTPLLNGDGTTTGGIFVHFTEKNRALGLSIPPLVARLISLKGIKFS